MGANKKLKALKHQRAVARRTSHQRQVAKARASSSPGRGPGGLPADVGSWRLREVLITESWREPGELVQILVARIGPSGLVAVAAFMVDLGCLGVKRANAMILDHVDDYEMGIRRDMSGLTPMVSTGVNLAARTIRDSVAYARDLGFQPDRDIRAALAVLGPADPDAAEEDVPLGGPEGKPYYIAGPYDNSAAIVRQLTQRLGPDGFEFAIPMTGPPDSLNWGQFELIEGEDEEEEEES